MKRIRSYLYLSLCVTVLMAMLMVSSCSPGGPNLTDDDPEQLKAIRENLKSLNAQKSDSATYILSPTVVLFPEVTGHLAIVDLRAGRTCQLIIQLTPSNPPGPLADTLKCDAGQMAAALSILETKKPVLYNRATLTFIYASDSYSIDQPLASR